MTYPDQTADSTAYDALGRVTSRTDANGKITQYGYDALGRLTSVTDALSQVTQYAYDEVGNRISQTDANNHTTSFQFDQRGRRTGRTLPAGQSESFTYDGNGNMLTHADFNGKTTTYTYDAGNRLLTKVPDPSLNETTVKYTYIPTTGQLATMVDASGTTSYSYTDAGYLELKFTPEDPLQYSYDLAGNVTFFGGGSSVDYTYDALNRLSTVADSNPGTTTYTYDAVGNLQSVTYPNGVVHTYAYDQKNRLTNLAAAGGAGAKPANFGYAYTLDNAGHRTSVTEKSGRTVNYGYDNIYRLTSEAIAGDPAANNGAVGYVYDPVGNRTQVTSTLAAIPAGGVAYDADDRLTSDAYDANGNTIGSGGINSAYDFENHLIQRGAGISIVYDGDGNRASKTVGGVTTTYLVDDLNPTGYPQVIYEGFSGGSGARELYHMYVYGLERISQNRNFFAGSQQTQISYYIYDGHGSTRALTDPTGSVTDTYDYDAFGNEIHSTGATPNEFLFAGEQYDPDLHLYYNRARYLNVSTGRFWTTDTDEGDDEEPLSLHKYLYAEGDPVDNVDSSGNEIDEIAAGAISETLDSMPSLNFINALNAAINAMGKVFLSGKAADKYTRERTKLLANADCLTCHIFLYSRGIDPYVWESYVEAQHAYDGRRSTDSHNLAGLTTGWTGEQIQQYGETPVKDDFVYPLNGTVAEAQTPGTDAYYDSQNPQFITQGEIGHEALHNMTGDTDDQLANALRITLGAASTDEISQSLVNNHCAGKD